MIDEDKIAERISHMKAVIGRNSDTMLLGMVVGAFGLIPESCKPDISPEYLAKIDNRDASDPQKAHLEYLKDKFVLGSLDHARTFSATIEQKLHDVYRRAAITESETGETVPDKLVFSFVMDTVFAEAERQKRTQSRQRN